MMAAPAFIPKPALTWNGRTSRRGRTCAAQPRMATSTKVAASRLTGWTRQPEAQGPHCPLIDKQLLKHCLLCAKKLKRERTNKDANVQELLSEARQAIGRCNRGRAERLYLRALVVDPGNTKPYFLYALQVQRRDPELARTLFSTGLREDPNNAKILQAWGLFESKQGKLARAQRLLRRSVDLEPRNAPVLRWKHLFPRKERKGRKTSKGGVGEG